MSKNPDETPEVEVPLPQREETKPRWNLGLRIALLNAFLVLVFPPYCKPLPLFYGLDAVGACLAPYLLLLGLPTTLAILISPNLVREYPHAFLATYIVNMVVVSYLLGRCAAWRIEMVRKRSIRDPSKEDEPTTPAR